MFTGIIETFGLVTSVDSHGAALKLAVEAGDYLHDVQVGESIAINGVCLTVTSLGVGRFLADVVEETVRCTNLSCLAPGDRVNLERALQLGDRMGGHFVQGHIDGTAVVQYVETQAESRVVTFSCDSSLSQYIADKGSVALEGVSLTVVQVDGNTFQVALIPHTIEVTTLGSLKPGSVVNVEVDVLAKYVFKLMSRREV